MITVRLWHALRNPQHYRHPFFQRILRRRRDSVTLPIRVLVGGSIIIGLFLVCGLTYVLPPDVLRRFVVLPLALPALYLLWVFGGTGRGVTLAGRVSAALADEHERDVFESLSTLPGGALGVYWLVACAYLYRQGSPEDVNRRQMTVTLVGFLLVTFVLFILYLNTWTREAMQTFQLLPFVLYPLVAIYYVDYVCSMISGVLVGALSAALVKKRLEGRLTAIGAFLSLQFGGYALVLWGALVLMPSVAATMGLDGLLARLSLAGVSVVLFFLLREAIHIGLWALLANRLGVAAAERAAVIEV